MKRLIVGVLLISTVVIVGFFAGANAAPVELKAVASFPRDNITNAQIPVWVESINRELKDAVKVNWVGGPEVMAPFDQGDAVRKGLMQIAFVASAYYMGMLPDADAISMSKYDFKKEREKGGVWDYYVKRHEAINLIPIGTVYYDPYYLWVRKPIKSLADAKGFKMRTAAKHDRMMTKLGMVPVSLQMPDTYSALQRGVVDGFAWPTLGPKDWGWTESCKYVIDTMFHPRMNFIIVMNLDAWKKLPKEVQAKITEVTVKFEPGMKAFFEHRIKVENGYLETAGVKRIKLSAEDSKKLVEAADQAAWENMDKKVPDTVIKEYKKVMGYK
jgi:TRAP-type transport system periplasmic protein